ncbi:MAG TPA: SDR family oxidoreductase [Balneolales bacterium]|nr:SDR family oxidoreductase [Balneolales bacterium]
MRIFITGSNRGIGLEFVKQYLKRGDRIFASCRNPINAKQLQKLWKIYVNQLTILPLDVRNPEAIQAAVKTVKSHTDGIDLLINNAGIGTRELSEAENGKISTFGKLDQKKLLHMLEVNAVAPVIVTQHFSELLKKGKHPRVINISSIQGSIDHNSTGGSYGYKASKAALNMYSRTLAYDLLPDNIYTVMFHPGWVQTDMGGKHASLTPEESVSSMIDLIDGFGKAQAGRFFNYNGKELNW